MTTLALLGSLHVAASPLLADGPIVVAVQFQPASVGLPVQEDDRFGEVLAEGDFDCDGVDDLAIGLPFWDVESPQFNEGQVVIVYGGDTGLDGATAWITHQGLGFLEDDPETDDSFGSALAVGNFDGAGCDDLAIGISGEAVEDLGIPYTLAGAVAVLFGQPGFGLATNGSQYLHRGSGLPGTPWTGDRLASSLAAGDFNGDGRDDLAVGIPDADPEGQHGAGEVIVVYGSPAGLSSDVLFAVSFSQFHMDGTASENGDHFGQSLASGDFDNDGRDDLAIGVPHEDHGAILDGGVLFVLPGTEMGLTPSGEQYWHESTPGVPGVVRQLDLFSWSLASGDFDGDGTDDLAVGVPGEPVFADDGTPISGVGRVRMIFGVDGVGLTVQDITSVTGYGLDGGTAFTEFFGGALATGDFDSDGRDELVIGAPQDVVNGVDEAGSVYLVGSNGSRIFSLRDSWDQGASSPGTPEHQDRFGVSLVVGDFNGDGRGNLVVGVPQDGPLDTGSVTTFYTVSGLFADGFESGNTAAWEPVSP